MQFLVAKMVIDIIEDSQLICIELSNTLFNCLCVHLIQIEHIFHCCLCFTTKISIFLCRRNNSPFLLSCFIDFLHCSRAFNNACSFSW